MAENISTYIEPVRQFMTRIDLALLQANNELFTLSAGDREDKQNVLLVFTDGRPFPPETFLLFNKSLPFLRVRYVIFLLERNQPTNQPAASREQTNLKTYTWATCTKRSRDQCFL